MRLAPVLYVEDEEDDVLFMRRAFTTIGIANRLDIARNGEEAIVYLKAAEASGDLPHLILLDLNLPILSGFDVLDWTRKSASFRETAICVLSSSDHPRDVERAKEQGADDFRVKPSSPVQLTAFVQQINQRWLSGLALSNRFFRHQSG